MEVLTFTKTSSVSDHFSHIILYDREYAAKPLPVGFNAADVRKYCHDIMLSMCYSQRRPSMVKSDCVSLACHNWP